MEIRTSYIIVP